MGNYENTIAANKRRATHGMHLTKVYSIWRSMKHRCGPSGSDRYAGRGIKVCKRWQKFESFYADMGDPPTGMSIDRINNNGNYTPSNCRWATISKQQNNMRSNVRITYAGKTQTMANWSRETGLPYEVIKYRHSRGWRPPLLFNTQNLRGKSTKYVVLHNNNELSVEDYATAEGIKPVTAYWRIKNKKVKVKL